MTNIFIEMGTKALKNRIDSLPDAAGVYIFKGSRKEILYVGKAKSLKKRVQSYFNQPLDTKTQILVSKICGLDYIVTPSEFQAQLLEAGLIKDKQPPYNISLKDDKSFPLIRISAEGFPAVSICRRKKKDIRDKALYLGPYTDAKLLRQALKVIRRIFGFRSCRKMPKSPCLYYRLNLCPAPCSEKITGARYQEIIRDIRMFLESRYEELLAELSLKMREAAWEKRFEEAAKIRNRIYALGAIQRGKAPLAALTELEDLKGLLNLAKLPQRIEAFDISNIYGKEATGSMVSFYRGFPDKDNYRRFRIKTVGGIDDYAMLREVLRRRYSRCLEEKLALPDLILIDGGRSHLSTAERELEGLGIKIPVAAIAKEKENIYIKRRPRPIKLAQDTPALNLIRRVRDEAHRFAVSYHHILRRKKIIGR